MHSRRRIAVYFLNRSFGPIRASIDSFRNLQCTLSSTSDLHLSFRRPRILCNASITAPSPRLASLRSTGKSPSILQHTSERIPPACRTPSIGPRMHHAQVPLASQQSKPDIRICRREVMTCSPLRWHAPIRQYQWTNSNIQRNDE